MHGQRALVRSCSYEGDGAHGHWVVRCVFENVPPAHRKIWTFRSGDLTIAVAAEVAGPHRKNLNL